MPLEAMAAEGGGLDTFRLTAPNEIATTLRRLQDASVLVNLNAPHGSVYTTSLWTADADRGALSFAADASDPQLQAVLESDEAVVVAYLDNVKIQFDVGNLVLVHGARSCALTTTYPREVFRFQRRDSFRVRPLLRDAPIARLAHPMIPDMTLALRILDLSVGGCALLLPQDVPMLEPGVLINRVQLELDADHPLRDRPAAAPRDLDPRRIERRAPGLRDGAALARRPSARCSATSTRRRSAGG